MIIDRYIPKNIDSIIGQDIPKKVMLSIIKNPRSSPKIINISGPPGTGKTILAKNFAKALSCNNQLKSGDACCECDECINKLVIYEYNGNTLVNDEDLETIRYISDSDSMKTIKRLAREESTHYYRIVLIEEIHRVSFKIQQRLLEIIDQSDEHLFFVTTADKGSELITSLKNRGMVIELAPIPNKDMKEHLHEIIDIESIDISERDIDTIVYRSEGNMRLAYMLLDKYKIIDRDLFYELLEDSRIYLIRFLVASFIGKVEEAENALTQLMRFPLTHIKQEYESLVLELMRIKTRVMKPSDKYISALYTACSNRMLDLFNILNDKVIYDMFENETELQSALWYIYTRVEQLKN